MKKIIFLIFVIGCSNNETKNANGYNTNNVVLITLDGVRWEEIFSGADPNIISNKKNDFIYNVITYFSQLLENQIKEYPEQYFWFHKKWDKKIY